MRGSVTREVGGVDRNSSIKWLQLKYPTPDWWNQVIKHPWGRLGLFSVFCLEFEPWKKNTVLFLILQKHMTMWTHCLGPSGALNFGFMALRLSCPSVPALHSEASCLLVLWWMQPLAQIHDKIRKKAKHAGQPNLPPLQWLSPGYILGPPLTS